MGKDPQDLHIPLLSHHHHHPLLRLVQRNVTDVDVIFSEFQEGPVYMTGQSVSRGNTAKTLAKYIDIILYFLLYKNNILKI